MPVAGGSEKKKMAPKTGCQRGVGPDKIEQEIGAYLVRSGTDYRAILHGLCG